jgi:copper chaperone
MPLTTGLEMVFEQLGLQLLDGAPDRVGLLQDVDAILVVLDHSAHGAEMSLNCGEASADIGLKFWFHLSSLPPGRGYPKFTLKFGLSQPLPPGAIAFPFRHDRCIVRLPGQPVPKEVLVSTVVLSVPDISCEHCERAITNALTAERGVQSVTVDIPAKTVKLSYDESQLSLDRVKDVLAEEEYPVEQVVAG